VKTFPGATDIQIDIQITTDCLWSIGKFYMSVSESRQWRVGLLKPSACTLTISCRPHQEAAHAGFFCGRRRRPEPFNLLGSSIFSLNFWWC
jgi:hypothetical protein